MAGVGSNMQQYLQGIQGLGRKLNTPTANMLGGAALGAGLSVAGNAMNGELEDKGAGRVALEALLAGAGGAAIGNIGSQLMRKQALKKKIESANSPYGTYTYPDEPDNFNNPNSKATRFKTQFVQEGVDTIDNINKMDKQYPEATYEYLNVLRDADKRGAYLDPQANILGSAAVLGGITVAGGLGGLFGGGLSNVAQAAGIPSFGSSNTASAKSGMGAATTAQPLYADQMSSDPNEQYLAYLAANQIPYA
jgi:hypothetical protein